MRLSDCPARMCGLTSVQERGEMSPQPTSPWPMEAQTQAKHEILRHYLNAWFPVMGHSRVRRVLYLDGFAGPGIYETGEPGSPILALTSLTGRVDFSRLASTEFIFLFNEMRPELFASLDTEIKRFVSSHQPWPTNVKIYLENGDFRLKAQELLDQIDRTGGHLVPTFAFIDPFGVSSISLSQLGALLSAPRCEMFLYLNFNEVQRFATSGQIDHHLEDLFGTSAFRDCPPAGDSSRKPWLLDLFVNQMHEVGRFDYVLPFEMIHNNGKTGSFLVFGTRSLKGLSAMKTAMWKVDPLGDFQFRARGDVLFGTTDTAYLHELIVNRFNGTTATIEDIVQFVLAETPFPEGYIKRKTLHPMEREGLITHVNRGSSRSGYPDGTQVTFA